MQNLIHKISILLHELSILLHELSILLQRRLIKLQNYPFTKHNIYSRMRMASEAGKQLAGLAFLDDPGPQMESKHWCWILFFHVCLVNFGFSFSHRQRIRLIGFDFLWSSLYIQENRLFGDSIMVFSPDNELSSVWHLHPVNHILR